MSALCDRAFEVEYETQPGKLWHIRYPLADGSGDLVVATTRPETFMGDTGVAVNPNDERYQHLIGKTCILPIMNREIPIFGDEYVDMEFGTGCVKVTPCHDPNDFEMGQRHDLEQILVFNEDATVNENGGKYEGMDRYECRKAVIKDLEDGGYLVKTEDHEHNVGTCYRCGTTVEPMTSAQWFVKMAPLAKPAMDVVHEGKTKFVPDRFAKTYLRWMENVHDWCISRQLWWGHRIPAFYCDDCGEMTVSKEDIHVCPKCGSKNVRQEEDVLDTWFSSGLWPFSTLGWPEKTPELEYFYPTSVLVTGYDIIFFWVARMIVFGMEVMGMPPFEYVNIHGIVRDSQGRKMSKSLNNGIDPLKVIEKYGADALRFSLANGTSPGSDMRFYDKKVEAAGNFANKIWNASRFVAMNLEGQEREEDLLKLNLDISDRWILSRLNGVIRDVTENLEKFELGLATAKIYDFIWSEYCDWYIEMCKSRLYGQDAEAKKTAISVLYHVLVSALKLLHPFMPFVTEEIFVELLEAGESIMISSWPAYEPRFEFAEEEQSMLAIMEVVRSVRNTRAEMNVPPAKKAKIIICTEKQEIVRQTESYLLKLANASQVQLLPAGSPEPENCAAAIVGLGQVYLPLGELIDVQKEMARLQKEQKNLEAEIARCSGKLQNQGFLAKAPAKVVQEEREKLEKYTQMLERVNARMDSLKAI